MHSFTVRGEFYPTVFYKSIICSNPEIAQRILSARLNDVARQSILYAILFMEILLRLSGEGRKAEQKECKYSYHLSTL